MSSKLKILNVLSSVALFGGIMFSGGTASFAEENLENNENIEIENIKGITYEFEGKEYKVPKYEFENFVTGKDTPNLPGIATEEDYGIMPLGNACQAGDEFDGKKTFSGFVTKKNGEPVINKTSKNLTETSSIGSEVTISGSVNGDAGWKWGPIKGTVGFDIGGSYKWVKSQSTTITVAPGEWGWIKYGSYNETWAGTYYTLSGSCTKSNVKNIQVKGPKTKAKMAYSERYTGK